MQLLELQQKQVVPVQRTAHCGVEKHHFNQAAAASACDECTSGSFGDRCTDACDTTAFHRNTNPVNHLGEVNIDERYGAVEASSDQKISEERNCSNSVRMVGVALNAKVCIIP
jgi:hypothetical protein